MTARKRTTQPRPFDVDVLRVSGVQRIRVEAADLDAALKLAVETASPSRWVVPDSRILAVEAGSATTGRPAVSAPQQQPRPRPGKGSQLVPVVDAPHRQPRITERGR